MKELNYDRLRAALDRLPSYTPPTGLWPGISSGLDAGPAEQQQVPELRLPEYSPPSTVWNSINTQLDQGHKQRSRMRVVYRWAAKAAGILLLFSAGYFTATRDPGPTVEVAETVERIPSTIARQPIEVTVASFGGEDPAFNSLLQELESLNRPSLNRYRYELQELTEAKEEVEAMLLSYGHDPAILNQLAEIERERSEVYRRIRAGM